VVLTTGGGLYRYDTEDLVEIVGSREACPLLRFIGRERHVSDHYGEKLNELFVRERLELALRDVEVRFAMLACEDDAYALFVESDACARVLTDAAGVLDAALRENVHYDYCRRLGQLNALRVFRVTRDGSSTFLASSGQRLGDVKLSSLDARRGWSGRFVGEWV
ncbi:MAG TPA: GH3 auxin-responsive promoter family protein, partial [Thermoanaerobaculia bacterium]